MKTIGNDGLLGMPMKSHAKKNPILSRFFSFLEFTVIYWIRNNFPILCYLLLLRIAKVGKFLIHKEDDSNFLGYHPKDSTVMSLQLEHDGH